MKGVVIGFEILYLYGFQVCFMWRGSHRNISHRGSLWVYSEIAYACMYTHTHANI